MRVINLIVAVLALIGLGAVILVGWAVFISVPGMKRYMKIREM